MTTKDQVRSTERALKMALEALALMVATEWTPAFTRKEYDSDEPEENKLRDHVLTVITAIKQALRQPEFIPDALTDQDPHETPEYRAGWNDCRALMLNWRNNQ